ncbi:MAG: sulfotransferase [Rhodospirillales bacterium]
MSTARKSRARKPRKTAAASAAKKSSVSTPVLKEIAGLSPEKMLETGRGRLDAGQADQAEQIADKLIADHPDEGAAHALKGLAAYRSKKFPEAVTSLRRAIELRPRDVTSISNLGAALNEVGDKAGALSAFRRALKIEPAHPGAVRNMVVGLVQAGKVDDAVSVLRKAVSADPGMASGYALFGDVERRRGRLLHARSHYCRALALEPDNSEFWNGLGICEMRRDQPVLAAAAYQRATELAPDRPEYFNSLGVALQVQGDVAAAVPAFEKAIELRPDHTDSLLNRGTALGQLGRFEEACTQYEDVLKVRPYYLQALYQLALYGKSRDQENLRQQFEEAISRSKGTLDEKVMHNFGLGEILQRLGDHEGSFAAYRRANDAKKEQLKSSGKVFNPVNHTAYISRNMGTYSVGFLRQRKGWGNVSDKPVFVCGMPRSGTTLVEQIIASHPKAHGAGELKDISRLSVALSDKWRGQMNYPECAARVTESEAAAMGQSYLDAITKLAPDAARVVDKMPANFINLGFIQTILPGARVIHTRRHPMDSCLSCYFQNFRESQYFSYDIRDLAAYYREYERLMAYWLKTLSIPVLEVQYEELVDNQEAVTREIIDFLDLEWDDACLNFHKTERLVQTASAWQVRQPINRTAVQRWRKYEPWLDDLRNGLGKFAD